jgi:oxalate decarboxylase/phosphoglucose isomerase-like protein (cupin superfamily)
MPAFSSETLAVLDAAYPENIVTLTHSRADHPLLSLTALVELAAALPEASVEYNPGALPIGIAPEDVPAPRLSVVETIRSIEENGSWMVLKRIEQHPDYAALLAETLAEIEPMVRAKTGAMLGMEGFVFISSPGAVTPFHLDPEHNILLQIRGSKVMTVFDVRDEVIVSPQAHEAFHLGKQHRNLVWQDDYSTRGTAHSLTPGDAIYVPVKSPHWVQNGADVSISLSVTWRSEWSYEEADARAMNHFLRGLSLTPASPKRWPHSNKPKSLAYRALRKLGIAGRG